MPRVPLRPPSRARFRRVLPVLLILLALPAAASLRAEPQRVTGANYKLAYKYSPEFLNKFAYSTTIAPTWIGKTDTFWYEYRTSKGKYFYRVNPQQATREPLFDNAKLATLLSEATRKPLEPSLLPVTRVSVSDDGYKMKFVTEDIQYEYDLRADKLNKLGKAPPIGTDENAKKGGGKKKEAFDEEDWLELQNLYHAQDEQQEQDEWQDWQDEAQQGKKGKGKQPAGGKQDFRTYSPDKKFYVFARDHNLYLMDEEKETETQLTKDGVQDYSFGGAGMGGKDDGKKEEGKAEGKGGPAAANWSKDSKSFYVQRTDRRGIKDLFLVNAVAQPRPALTTYKYAMPGEPNINRPELHVWHKSTGKLVRVTPKWKDENYSNLHWGKNPNELRFNRHDRLIRNVEFCSLNLATNECRCLIADGFENANIVTQPIRYLDESDEMIWWSERSGWGHYYLYDRAGKLKNAISSGPYRASTIVTVDPKNRMVYFRGNSREDGENAYYEHLYSVRFDGSGLTLLDPGNANHQSYLSPSKQFVVDNCSRLDMAPVIVVRDHRGNKVMDLEKADLSRLMEVGWRMPETFSVKAADGVTDLFGNMWKPFDFDPSKKYPIIAHVYPGPQTESMTQNFGAVSQQQQLAQLGFIVIQVGNRGGSPLRSKLYGSFGYWNLRDYALADKKTAIEQLAARHSYMDVERVGIYGHSGGGFLTAAALLQKPYNEFFKVGVSSAGNHDNNIYNNSWSERYHGLKEVTVDKDAKKAESTTPPKGKKKGKGDDEATDQDKDGKKDEEKKDEGKETKKDEGKKEEGKKDDGKKEETKKDDGKKETRFEIKVPTNAELAANLKGKLLLVHGDMDNNVHPANTMRLVDALVRANKRFDMIILPGKAHGFADFQPYFTQRMWEYFAEHLLDDRTRGADLYDRKDAR